MTDSLLASALGLALTGEELPLTDPDALNDELTAAGYPADRLQEIRRTAQAEQSVWPFRVPVETLRAIGFARFDAALADARRSLGLDGLVPATPAQRPLNRDEQRLAADRPPHWG
ncbi:MAG TPA: hypothetical protein K8V15_02825 [Tessaracoccus flavescens]|uniref:Uncharacterized protein n=1 Tax=Tessaracoccus flavescens TaxID=399497 RepID=A0A921ENL9_9ACTN|nr:hypothetical protein [Tessaracoccus flavescens]